MHDSRAERSAAPRSGLAAPAGFLVLLAVLFAAAYAAGSAVGPVAPGPRPAGEEQPLDGPGHGGCGH
ncbi:hypothetical protein [Streptomyces marincola]|uniref:hypothetical protein n=1 Tax=Streptomyces marincola TaxID=2878388 RepID=UPI001CF4B08D|nr:hypothetical protein [Streptomyces marincola]UCM89828.1 hypothetical protein LC193_18765 [Streptomyces marincola]